MAILDRVFREDARISPSGDPFFLTRARNVRSAVENRFSTFFNSVVFLRGYGASLKKFAGESITSDLFDRIEAEVRTNIKRDFRISGLDSLEIEADERTGELKVRISFRLISSREISTAEVVI